MSFKMPRVYPNECNTPSMFVPLVSSCNPTRKLPMSLSVTFGGSAPFAAALTSAAVMFAPKTNHGDSTSGKNRWTSPLSPANRFDRAVVRAASRRTHAMTSLQKSLRSAGEMSWYRPWSRRTIVGGTPPSCLLAASCLLNRFGFRPFRVYDAS
eukprot:30647-Pelagococcus_subviridis.AAC.1